jgi:hypothetical protein
MRRLPDPASDRSDDGGNSRGSLQVVSDWQITQTNLLRGCMSAVRPRVFSRHRLIWIALDVVFGVMIPAESRGIYGLFLE